MRLIRRDGVEDRWVDCSVVEFLEALKYEEMSGDNRRKTINNQCKEDWFAKRLFKYLEKCFCS